MQRFNFKKQPPMDLVNLRIDGSRVSLRSINEGYGADIFKEFNSEITRYMIPKPAGAISETLAFISKSLDGMRGGWDLVLAITRRSDAEFLGCCGLHGRRNPRTPELGIWLKKDAHGQKYGREAIETLTSWAVENIEFDYAIYPVDKANIASRKIPEALGGVILAEKKVTSMAGHVLDEIVYKIP